MIKLKKFNNVFGISNLNGGMALDRINVVYAPNGTAKSSISDALEIISTNDGTLTDVVNPTAVPSYEIDVDGTVFDESNPPSIKVIKYSGVESFELENNESYKPLVMSPSLTKTVKASITSINNSLNKIQNILSSCFPKKCFDKSGGFSKGIVEALSIIADDYDDDEKLLLSFVQKFDINEKPFSSPISEGDFYILVNQKASDAINTPSVQQSMDDYASFVKQKVMSTVLDDNFTISNLTNFFEAAKKEKYFDDKGFRKLKIGETEYDQVNFEKLVENEINQIFGSDEAKQKIEECKKALNKNAAAAKFTMMVLANPTYLSEASDYKKFVNKLFITIFDKQFANFILEKKNIENEQKKLLLLKQNFSNKDNMIHQIWLKYKTRFTFDKFDLDIKNKFDAMIGSEAPFFVKYYKGTRIEIKDPKQMRFSTGEIKSFNLINGIIEIELARLSNTPFTLVLDDAVDSFDYKNKYGIIDYICDLAQDTNVQIIIFTHNFDFYRSSILALGKTNVQQFFMYKDASNVVTLYPTTGKQYYLEIARFNDWKNTNDTKKLISLIPFYRNVIQLQTNRHNTHIGTIDDYLHFDISKENQDFNPLVNAINQSGISPYHPTNLTDSFLKILMDETNSICTNNVNETDLENKMVLGIFIRIFTERFLTKKLLANGVTIGPSINVYSKTRDLINLAEQNGCLTEEEKMLITEANIIAPSYAHANSFMYEPLIDVDCAPLIRISLRLLDLNNTWPL